MPRSKDSKEEEVIGDDKEDDDSPDKKKRKLDDNVKKESKGSKRKSKTYITREAVDKKKQGFCKQQAEKMKRQYKKTWK